MRKPLNFKKCHRKHFLRLKLTSAAIKLMKISTSIEITFFSFLSFLFLSFFAFSLSVSFVSFIFDLCRLFVCFFVSLFASLCRCLLVFIQIRTKNNFLNPHVFHILPQPPLARLSLFLPTHQNLNNSNVLIATTLLVCRFQIWKIKEISWIASWKTRKELSQLIKERRWCLT